MSRHSRSVLFLLQRCVSGRPVTLPTGIKPRGSSSSSLFSGSCGFIQQRTWTSTARTVCQLQSVVRSSQYRFCTKAGESSDDEYPPLPAYQCEPEQEKKDVYIIQVKGLPWLCTAHDLLHFFSECRIRDGLRGIHFTLDQTGKPSGQAFIEMEHEEDVSKALEKHRQYLGPRYIEVLEVTNRDAEALLNKVVQVAAEKGVVRIRGLPYSCNEDDIANFFSGLNIEKNGITIVTDHRGRNSGEAFVQFSSTEAAAKALKRDREVIGNRYIEVFPSRSDLIYSSWKTRTTSASPNSSTQSAKQRNVFAPQNNTAPSAPPQSSASLLHYIHMRGLPFNVSVEDIVMFFSPLVVSKIVIECSPEGRPCGEADIYFRCHRDALTAMSRDRGYIGERYIELFLNSAPEERR